MLWVEVPSPMLQCKVQHKLFHKAFGYNQARARPCALTYSSYKFRDLAVKQTVLQLPVKHPVITVGALLVKGAYYVGASYQLTWDFKSMGNGAGKYTGEFKDITVFLHNMPPQAHRERPVL